jgi:hypothetical protein
MLVVNAVVAASVWILTGFCDQPASSHARIRPSGQIAKPAPQHYLLPPGTYNVVPSPDAKWLAAWTSGDPVRDLWVCSTARHRWKYIASGSGYGTWSFDSRTLAFAKVGKKGYPKINILFVPGYKVVVPRLPYGFEDFPSYSPMGNEIAFLAGPKDFTARIQYSRNINFEVMQGGAPLGFLTASTIILPRRSSVKYDPALKYDLGVEVNIHKLFDGTTLAWSPAGDSIAMIRLDTNGDGTISLVNLRTKKCVDFGHSLPDADRVWILDNGWIVGSQCVAALANGPHLRQVNLFPVTAASNISYEVLDVCETGHDRFRIAVDWMNIKTQKTTCEVWEASSTPSPRVTRRLFSLPLANDHIGGDISEVRFAQQGKSIWIPADGGTKICAYSL